MIKTLYKLIAIGFIISTFSFSMQGVNYGVQAQDSFPPKLEPYLSEDGLTLYNAYPTLVIKNDPDPARQGIKIPAPDIDRALASPDAAGATFSITYVAAGGTDLWGEPCFAFPSAAKTAFNAAAAIWTNTIQSSVPITIKACWANLGATTTLGYSGGGPLHRDFTGAPRANTWYTGSLANALHGSDLSTSSDMNITYNSNFTWYYGTDSNPPAGQHDLVSVAAHEIAHGLNFSGSAQYSGGTGSYGYGGYPHIYDTFVESGSGTKLTAYTNSSVELGDLLTSNSLYFDGSNANAANSGSRVKLYAPSTWDDGSSYAHLNYSTFAGTVNSLMVYAIAAGSANHNPGPVTKGLLKDLGWRLTGTSAAQHFIYSVFTQRLPKAGFWEGPWDELYVTPNRVNVDNFATYLWACGVFIKVTHNQLVPIENNQFSFSGPFYFSGTFDDATHAHGVDGLDSLYVAGCGYVTAGPWNYTVTWQNSTQPSIVIEGDTESIIIVPELKEDINHNRGEIVQ